MSMGHEHFASHLPNSGTGVAICECGASRRVENFKPVEPWHTCALCVPRLFGGSAQMVIDEPLDERDIQCEQQLK